LIEDLNRRGQTVLLVTHDDRLAERYAHRVVHLVDGSVAGDRATQMVA
jgi:putative ABC transport system ATP-binding protein